MKIKNAKLIILVLILQFIISSCSKPIEQIDIDKSIDNIFRTKELICDRLYLFENDDYSYSYLPDEVPGDLYSTYYSLMYLELINEEHVTPLYSKAVFDSVRTIQDIFYITEIFKNTLDDLAINHIYENVNNLYNPDGYFIIDTNYKTLDIHGDDNLLFSTWTACKIFQSINRDYDYSSIRNWLESYDIDIKNKVNPDMDYFDLVLMYYELCLLLDLDTSEIIRFIELNIAKYETQLMQELGSIEFVFHLSTYMTLIEHLGKSIDTNKFIISEIVKMYKIESGGFSISSRESTNPLPVYIFSKLIYNSIDYDFSNCTKYVLRHQRNDAMFIPYVISEGDIESTYYAYLTLIQLGINIDSELSQYCEKNKNERNSLQYIYLDSLSTKEIADEYIMDIVTDLSTKKISSINDINRILLLLQILEDKNIVIPDDLTNRLCDSLLKYITEVSAQKDKQIRSALKATEYAALSAYLMLNNQNKSINKLVQEILSNMPKDNLFSVYYYVRLHNIASDKINIANIPFSFSNELIYMLDNCASDLGNFSFEYDDISISMVSNYYGVYISNYLYLEDEEKSK